MWRWCHSTKCLCPSQDKMSKRSTTVHHVFYFLHVSTVNCEHTFIMLCHQVLNVLYCIVRLKLGKRKPGADQKHCKAREHKERRRGENWLAMISCIWAKTERKESKNGGYNHVSTLSLSPLLYTGPIPLFQLPPSSEWSSVDYTLYLPLLSHSFAASLGSWLAHTLAAFRHTYINNIHT